MTIPTPDLPTPDYVIEDRGGIVENRHLLHAAITDGSGRLLYAVGDPRRLTLIRSAAKPAQSVAVLEALASPSPSSTLPTSFSLSGSDIALMSASHSSEPAHLALAADMLERGGNTSSDYRCGGHPALLPGLNAQWIRDGLFPEAIHNNCSGKHAGMLAATRALGGDVSEYHLPGSPIQQRVKEVVEDLCSEGRSGEEIKWATDGCNLPAPAMSLVALAGMYAAFAAASDAVASSPPTSDVAGSREGNGAGGLPHRVGHMARVFDSMHTHPFFVSGTDRFCAAVATLPGVVGKIGADACYGVGVRSSTYPGGLGIAAKIEDGNVDILYAAVAEILERLGVGSDEERRVLEPWHKVDRRNTAGVKVGEVSFPFVLRSIHQ